ncbi:MAG: shikimate dehydrogenase [Bacteroidales bacterium]|nr:shikimate dehydrogenase [Bacteroidales bacterium]
MRTFGLIGFPLSHSFSPDFFAKKFENEGITDTVYRLFEIQDVEQLRPMIHRLPNLCGLNVTTPYKEEVLSLMDNLTEEASVIGAVNTIDIKRQGNLVQLTGHNTDASGFGQLLQKYKIPADTSALILGTGGAAKAVAFALEKRHISYKFVSRSHRENALLYSGLDAEIIRKSRLIIHATPLGMWPHVSTLPRIPYQAITPQHLLIDLIYNPAVTAFMQEGAKAGATVVNGLTMLHAQAEASWNFWNKK